LAFLGNPRKCRWQRCGDIPTS